MVVKEFNVTLFSNSNMSEFPENNLVCFTNKLEKKIFLDENTNCHVGLSHIFLNKFVHPYLDKNALVAMDLICFDYYKNSSKELSSARKEFVLDPIDAECSALNIRVEEAEKKNPTQLPTTTIASTSASSQNINSPGVKIDVTVNDSIKKRLATLNNNISVNSNGDTNSSENDDDDDQGDNQSNLNRQKRAKEYDSDDDDDVNASPINKKMNVDPLFGLLSERAWKNNFAKNLKANDKLWTFAGFIKLLLSKSTNVLPYHKSYFGSLLHTEIRFSHKIDIGQPSIEDHNIEFNFDAEDILSHNLNESMSLFFPYFSKRVFEIQKYYWQNLSLRLNYNFNYKLIDIFKALISEIIEKCGRFYNDEFALLLDNEYVDNRVTLSEFYAMLWDERKKVDSNFAKNSGFSFSEINKLYGDSVMRAESFVKRFINYFVDVFLRERTKILKENNQTGHEESHFIFVSTNISELQQVGSGLYPIIKIIPCQTSTEGNCINLSCNPITYQRVKTRVLDNISISLSYENGNFVSMIPGSVPSFVSLNFKIF